MPQSTAALGLVPEASRPFAARSPGAIESPPLELRPYEAAPFEAEAFSPRPTRRGAPPSVPPAPAPAGPQASAVAGHWLPADAPLMGPKVCVRWISNRLQLALLQEADRRRLAAGRGGKHYSEIDRLKRGDLSATAGRYYFFPFEADDQFEQQIEAEIRRLTGQEITPQPARPERSRRDTIPPDSEVPSRQASGLPPNIPSSQATEHGQPALTERKAVAAQPADLISPQSREVEAGHPLNDSRDAPPARSVLPVLSAAEGNAVEGSVVKESVPSPSLRPSASPPLHPSVSPSFPQPRRPSYENWQPRDCPLLGPKVCVRWISNLLRLTLQVEAEQRRIARGLPAKYEAEIDRLLESDLTPGVGRYYVVPFKSKRAFERRTKQKIRRIADQWHAAQHASNQPHSNEPASTVTSEATSRSATGVPHIIPGNRARSTQNVDRAQGGSSTTPSLDFAPESRSEGWASLHPLIDSPNARPAATHTPRAVSPAQTVAVPPHTASSHNRQATDSPAAPAIPTLASPPHPLTIPRAPGKPKRAPRFAASLAITLLSAAAWMVWSHRDAVPGDPPDTPTITAPAGADDPKYEAILYEATLDEATLKEKPKASRIDSPSSSPFVPRADRRRSLLRRSRPPGGIPRPIFVVAAASVIIRTMPRPICCHPSARAGMMEVPRPYAPAPWLAHAP